jgi:hypothetical protein
LGFKKDTLYEKEQQRVPLTFMLSEPQGEFKKKNLTDFSLIRPFRSTFLFYFYSPSVFGQLTRLQWA